MIRLTRTGAILRATPDEVRLAHHAWKSAYHLAIPDLLDRELFAAIAGALDQDPFAERTHRGLGAELCAEGGRALTVLQFLANDPSLFRMIRELTGAGPIGCFAGRIYRQMPGRGHHDEWHDDACSTRIVALSVNLGAEVYQGGVLQIRERESGQIVAEVANTRPGGAVLFPIASHLQHRITEVTGTVAKTAYAGWFRAEPDFRDILAGRATF